MISAGVSVNTVGPASVPVAQKASSFVTRGRSHVTSSVKHITILSV